MSAIQNYSNESFLHIKDLFCMGNSQFHQAGKTDPSNLMSKIWKIAAWLDAAHKLWVN